ncbi:hypothetical protein BOX17_14635 [Halomonas aestuarii]|uniref:Uncharacterized protein n=1 Tax=Halomonas aestuarii TaxID=1897729 RepID=A0A1J0VJ88_9GAMM|nr:hypothetical protein BOX17_14635 [Halomonas aestuarii]
MSTMGIVTNAASQPMREAITRIKAGMKSGASRITTRQSLLSRASPKSQAEITSPVTRKLAITLTCWKIP